jgi:hypothetical protein
MNTFEDQIRVTLHELAEEAVPMNLADQALRGARRRRIVLATAGATVFTAVGLTLTPLALAGIADNPHPVGTPSPPAASPTDVTPQPPVPSPPAPSPTVPAPTVTTPLPSPTGTGPVPSPTVSVTVLSPPPPVPSPTHNR